MFSLDFDVKEGIRNGFVMHGKDDVGEMAGKARVGYVF